jgi:hypothetical protein
MKDYITKELRRLSFVPGKEKTWISQLTDDQLYEIYQRLANGETARSIATSIKEQWGINPDASAHSVGQAILTFKKRITHLLLNLPKPDANNVNHSLPDSSEHLTSLERLEAKARQYEDRIEKIMANEKATGQFYPYLSRDFQALASLRKAILKQKDWETKHPDPLVAINDAKRTQTMTRQFNILMDTLGEEGQKRIVEASQRFLAAVEKHAISMEINPETGMLQRVSEEEINQEEG